MSRDGLHIKTLKINRIIKTTTKSCDYYNYTVHIDAIHLAQETWNKVSAGIIQNCFHRRGGFIIRDDKTGDEHEHRLSE